MKYQELNIDLEMGTKYLINESAYFLGGIFAANENVTRNDRLFWIAPVRHNPGYLTPEELEEHFISIKASAAKLNNETLMSTTIKSNNLDSGKFGRLSGFGTFFESKNKTPLNDMIPDIKTALFASSQEVKRCFIAGMFDGRGSIDINKKNGKIRYIVLDCENSVVGNFLSEVVNDYGFNYNYNQARERLEGGNPRKDQLRIAGSEDYIEKIGFISRKKFEVAFSAYNASEYDVIEENQVLLGLKKIVRR